MEIVVFYGGSSDERAVSLRSGARICEALLQKGHTVVGIDALGEVPSAEEIRLARSADAVFLAFHGGAGEDGHWQAALEAAGVFHYTGSDAAASALAMDKPRAKVRVGEFGVPLAIGAIWRAGEGCPTMEFPFVIKPCNGGSSIGFQVVNEAADIKNLVPSGDLLCESYLPGAEYSVGVLEGRALPPVQICPVDGLYDYAHKYTENAAREWCPAPIGATRTAQLQDLALLCFTALLKPAGRQSVLRLVHTSIG